MLFQIGLNLRNKLRPMLNESEIVPTRRGKKKELRVSKRGKTQTFLPFYLKEVWMIRLTEQIKILGFPKEFFRKLSRNL